MTATDTKPAILLGCLLLVFGCALPGRKQQTKLPPLPDGPGYLARGPVPLDESLPRKTITLEWEHDAGLTSGFVVERSTNATVFTPVGFVAVGDFIRQNPNNFTYHWSSTNEPPVAAVYRVGAIPTNQDP